MKNARRRNPVAQLAAARGAFRNMDAVKAQEIRDAYYKAVEGLMTLAELLPETGLDNEAALAKAAEAIMDKSLLGAVL